MNKAEAMEYVPGANQLFTFCTPWLPLLGIAVSQCTGADLDQNVDTDQHRFDVSYNAIFPNLEITQPSCAMRMRQTTFRRIVHIDSTFVHDRTPTAFGGADLNELEAQGDTWHQWS